MKVTMRTYDQILERMVVMRSLIKKRDYHSRVRGRLRELEWVLCYREADKL